MPPVAFVAIPSAVRALAVVALVSSAGEPASAIPTPSGPMITLFPATQVAGCVTYPPVVLAAGD